MTASVDAVTSSENKEVTQWKDVGEAPSLKKDPSSSPLFSNETPLVEKGGKSYAPIVDTLRLYAGWLLAWYFLIFSVGSYQYLRSLPFQIPYVDELVLSPLLVHTSFAAYLFLLFSLLHRKLRGGPLTAVILMIAGGVIFAFYYRNV